MQGLYRCEIPDCDNLTDDSLCKEHQLMLEREDLAVIACKKCNTILRFVDRLKINNKYGDKFLYVENCPQDKLYGVKKW